MGPDESSNGLEYPGVATRARNFDRPTDPQVSVVVVTYRTRRGEFEALLAGLAEQTSGSFETIVVDNGNDWSVEELAAAHPVVDRYVRLDRNRGVTVGRNVGAGDASADVVTFLDDDAVPHSEFVAAHRRAYAEHDIIAARGRIRPKTRTVYNRIASWYDLGDDMFPFMLNIEGNTSVDAAAFESVGGFTDLLDGRAGHEGIELTSRLLDRGFDRDAIVYHPDAVIFHDHAISFREFVSKKVAMERANRLLRANHVDVHEFARTYETPSDEGQDISKSSRIIQLSSDAIVQFLLKLSPPSP